MATIKVSESTVKERAPSSPNCTPLAPVKLAPLIATFVPPKTDPEAGVVDILEAAADRGAIEQANKDVKEVWGAGQQQLRNLYANVAGDWLGLGEYLKSFIPEIKLGTQTIIPAPNADPSSDSVRSIARQ